MASGKGSAVIALSQLVLSSAGHKKFGHGDVGYEIYLVFEEVLW